MTSEFVASIILGFVIAGVALVVCIAALHAIDSNVRAIVGIVRRFRKWVP